MSRTVKMVDSSFVSKPLAGARMAILAALLLIAACTGGASFAQENPCGGNELTRVTLANVRSAGKDVQNKAAISLIQNWSSSLPDLMREIAQIKPSSLGTLGPVEKQWAVFVVEIVKTMLASNDQSISLFRRCPIKGEAVKVLSWLARSDDAAFRLNAANILANAVDNSTVCFVVHHLRDLSISRPGRANLLGVTRAMASYAYKDNVEAIASVVERIGKAIDGSSEDLTQTRNIMVDITDRLQRSSNRNAPIPAELKDYCKDYQYSDRPAPI